MSDECNYLVVARRMVGAAADTGLLSGQLAVVPELADIEKKFFTVLIAEIKRDERDDLTQDEIARIFNFVIAKACETVSCWHADKPVDFGFEDIFSAEVPLTGDADVIAAVRESEINRIMGDAFFRWVEEELPEESDIDPMLPLMEALKWTWRITVNVALDVLGH